MKLLSELLTEANKRKTLKRAAKAVYHRDYMKTRKKAYRKYDPETRTNVSEGIDQDAADRYATLGVAELTQELEYAKEDLAMARETGEDSEVISEIEDDIRALEGQLEAIRTHQPRMQNEGMFDFAIGAGKHVGDRIRQGVTNTVAAGKRASLEGDVKKLVATLAQSLQQYDALKPQQAQPQQAQPQQRTEPTMQQAQPQQATTSAGGASDAFRTSDKPRGRMGQHGFEYTFSSYLMDLDDTESFLPEGVWDFVRGAGKHVATSIGSAVQGTVNAGKEASRNADFERTRQTAQQTLKQLIQVLQGVGPNAGQVLAGALKSIDPVQAKRCVGVIQAAAKKVGLEI